MIVNRQIVNRKHPHSVPNTPTLALGLTSGLKRELHQTAHLKISAHPTRPQRYLLTISDSDRSWAYPVAWSHAEVQALRMMARETIYRLDLSLTPEGPPKDVGKLHTLIEQLFPSVARVAAMAEARAEEVAA